VTWQRINDPERAGQIDFRHELEFGVTDKFQVQRLSGGFGFTKTIRNIPVSHIPIQRSS